MAVQTDVTQAAATSTRAMLKALDKPLSETERAEFIEREAVIEKGFASFIEVGSQLITIRDKRLYREAHKNFEAYVQERWQISRSRAYQLISAGLLSTTVDIAIPNEWVARKVLGLPQADRAPVLVLAHKASSGEIDASWVKSAQEVYQEAKATGGYVSDDEGGMTAAVAAVVDNRAERVARKQQHIRDNKEREQGTSEDTCHQGSFKVLSVDPTSGDLLINAPDLAAALCRGEIVTYIVYQKASKP